MCYTCYCGSTEHKPRSPGYGDTISVSRGWQMETPEFDLERFLDFSKGVVIEGMRLVRPYQLGEKRAKASIKKADRTLVTPVDKQISAMMRRQVEENFPGVDHNIEDDDGKPTAHGSRYKIWGDPIDGTLPFALGAPTSTVIFGVHDTEQQRVLACVIGEPMSGQLWFTRRGKAFVAQANCKTGLDDYEQFTVVWSLDKERRVKVWDGKFGRDAAVFLDNPRGFPRGKGKEKRTILSHEEVGRLIESLRHDQDGGKLQLYGSNGLFHALVAQGAEHDKVAGGITSAMGGCQDVMGVKLILDAGGAARAFRSHTGVRKDSFHEVHPEAIEEYDILVYGNNIDTVNRLSAMVLGLRS
jgi:hypothetical protein